MNDWDREKLWVMRSVPLGRKILLALT